jgi:hypothetical protein
MDILMGKPLSALTAEKKPKYTAGSPGITVLSGTGMMAKHRNIMSGWNIV